MTGPVPSPCTARCIQIFGTSTHAESLVFFWIWNGYCDFFNKYKKTVQFIRQYRNPVQFYRDKQKKGAQRLVALPQDDEHKKMTHFLEATGPSVRNTEATADKTTAVIRVSNVREWSGDFRWLTKHSLALKTEKFSLMNKIVEKSWKKVCVHDALTCLKTDTHSRYSSMNRDE